MIRRDEMRLGTPIIHRRWWGKDGKGKAKQHPLCVCVCAGLHCALCTVHRAYVCEVSDRGIENSKEDARKMVRDQRKPSWVQNMSVILLGAFVAGERVCIVLYH